MTLRTLWLFKNTLFNTGPQRLVEERVKHGVGDRQVVVGLDKLLQRLARRAIAILELKCVLALCQTVNALQSWEW